MADRRNADPPTPDELHTAVFPRIMRGIARVYAHGYHRLRVHGPVTIPTDGPAIVICNHISGLDPILIQAATSRSIQWMMTRDYYDLPSTNWLLRRVGVIPVNRDGKDSASLRQAIRVLRGSGVIGIFPEGRIETARELLPFQPGVAILADRGHCPVIPAYLEATTRGQSILRSYLSPQSASLRFGEPLSPVGETEDFANSLENAVRRLGQAVVNDG